MLQILRMDEFNSSQHLFHYPDHELFTSSLSLYIVVQISISNIAVFHDQYCAQVRVKRVNQADYIPMAQLLQHLQLFLRPSKGTVVFTYLFLCSKGFFIWASFDQVDHPELAPTQLLDFSVFEWVQLDWLSKQLPTSILHQTLLNALWFNDPV